MPLNQSIDPINDDDDDDDAYQEEEVQHRPSGHELRALDDDDEIIALDRDDVVAEIIPRDSTQQVEERAKESRYKDDFIDHDDEIKELDELSMEDDIDDVESYMSDD